MPGPGSETVKSSTQKHTAHGLMKTRSEQDFGGETKNQIVFLQIKASQNQNYVFKRMYKGGRIKQSMF